MKNNIQINIFPGLKKFHCKSGIFLILFGFTFLTSQTSFSQNINNNHPSDYLNKKTSQTKNLNLKLQISKGNDAENKANFETAKFFILKKNSVFLLKQMKLEESFIDEPSKKRNKITDALYLKAASLILAETDNRQNIPGLIAGWNYEIHEKEVDEDMTIISFSINNRFKEHLLEEIYFEGLHSDKTLQIPKEVFYLFGYCRTGDKIIVWNTLIKKTVTKVKLDQSNAEFISTWEDFLNKIDNL